MSDIETAKIGESVYAKCCGTSRPAEDLGANPYQNYAKASIGLRKGAPRRWRGQKRRCDPCGAVETRLNELAALVFDLLQNVDWSHLSEDKRCSLMNELASYALKTSDGGRSWVERENEVRREVQDQCEKNLEQGFQEAYEIILQVRDEKARTEKLLLGLVRHVAEKGGTVPSEVAAWLTQYAERFIPGPLTARVGDHAKVLVKGV